MSPLKLVYVDDEPDLREIASFAIELDGEIELRTYPSGRDALDALDSSSWRPDGFLLDVMMPDMDGPTLLQHLRERVAFSTTPVVFITARAQPNEHQAFLDRGALGVITKPFDPMTLARRIRSILGLP